MVRRKTEDAESVVLPPGIKIDPRGTRYYDLLDKHGKKAIRVGYYHDPIIDRPEGMSRFLDFLPTFGDLVDAGKYRSLVFDGVSFASISGRKYHQYDLNADAKDPRQWYGGAVDLLEEIIAIQLPGLTCNVGIAMHTSVEKIEAEGTKMRGLHVPGRLRHMIAGAYPEVYRLHVIEGKEGKKFRVLQTESDGKWLAGTCIDAPDDTVVYRDAPEKTWEKLWSCWNGDRHAWHGIVYSEPHAGKSTLLSMLPKPMYVALFDGVGKDAAYRRRGTITPSGESAGRKSTE